jgi:DNA-binding NarL/FixJ family response regulator
MEVKDQKGNYALVVDDHPMYRDGLKNTILKTNKFSKVLEASNGQESLELIKKTPQVSVVFMDIEMPVMNGVEAAKLILKEKSNLKIIVTTMFSEPQYVKEMIALNVSGYILKDSSRAEITKALSMVIDDQNYFSPKVQKLIADMHLMDEKTNHTLKPTGEKNEVTSSQKKILELLCRQYSNADIAEELGISELTVKRHRQDLLLRTESRNFAGLIVYAIKNDIYIID